jgi:siderophore synthetase component
VPELASPTHAGGAEADVADGVEARAVRGEARAGRGVEARAGRGGEAGAGSEAGARAAVLARLWGALAREPVPGVAGRQIDGRTLTITLTDGRRLRGPVAAAQPFAVPPSDLTIEGGDPLHLFGDRLATELDNSVENLALARAAQSTPDGGAPALRRGWTLVDFEQSVVDGHPLHPGCRTRLGLSRDEVLRYAPEHHPIVALRLVDVPPERWYGAGGPPVLTVHPWQFEHVLDRYPFLRPRVGTVPAHPLMSLRTLARADDPTRQVKTAVDVQMTSAIRTVSPAAVHNGPLLSRLLAGLGGDELTVLPEVAAGAVLVDGEPVRSLAVLHRRMPALAPGEVALPLAALFAPSPASGRPIVTEIVADGYAGDALSCVEALAARLLPPLLRLLSLGVALEAHGQNLLIVVQSGRFRRLLYRDLGGVRISPRRLAGHGIEAPPLQGDLRSDDPDELRAKVFASAVSTVLGELVAVLGRELGLDEGKAWRRVAGAVRPVDGPDAAALFGATLPIKAMTAMRLAADPVADIWAELPNPMADL